MSAIKHIILLLLVGICSCKSPKDLVYQSMENCKVQKAGLDKTTLCMDIRLYNPNKHTIKLKQADVVVFLNGNKLGQMKLEGKHAISRLDTFSLPVLLDVDLKNALSNALQLMLMGSDVTIKLTGTIKAGRHGMYVKVPIDYEGKQDIFSGIKW